MSLEGADDVFTTKKEKTLESEKQKLRDKQEDEYGDPDNIYVKIKIPTKGKVGKKYTVKFSRKVPTAQLIVSNTFEWKRKNKYDSTSKPELLCTPYEIIDAKDCKEIKYNWEQIGHIGGKEINILEAGEYFIQVRAYSIGAGEETTSQRIIKIIN